VENVHIPVFDRFTFNMWSRDSVDGVVTRLRAGQWRIRGSESVRTGCWAYPAFHSLGNVGKGALPGIEEPGREGDHSSPISCTIKNE